MRATGRACILAAVLLTVVAFTVPSGAGAAGGGGSAAIFDGVAAASGVHEQFDAIGGFAPTAEPVYGNVPDAITVFNPNTPQARASTSYPGATAAGLGDIFCGQVYEPNFKPHLQGTPLEPLNSICPTPPFPLDASAPTPSGKPDATTPGSQKLGGPGPAAVTADSATAHADHKGVAADAVDSSFNTVGTTASAASVLTFRRQMALLSGGPVAAAAVQPAASDHSAAHADSAEATSHQSFPDAAKPDQLVATATSTVHGVNLLGGAIHIDSVVSNSTFIADAQGHPSHTQTTRVTGVTAGGLPATIDQNGISVNGSGQGKPLLDAANAALQQLLSATGSHVRAVSPTTSSKPGQVPAGLSSGALDAYCTTGEADGVQLYQQLDARQVPQGQLFFLSVTFASACSDAVVNANLLGGSTVTPTGAVVTPSATTSSDGSIVQGTSTAPSTGSSAGPSSAALPAVPNATSATGTATIGALPPTGRVHGVLGGLEAQLAGHRIAGRFTLLYLAFTLGFAGIVLGTLPLVSPRLPHHR